MAIFPVVLDSCVLFPALIRDILLRAAEANLYQVLWSEEILYEVTSNLVKLRKLDELRATYLTTEMNKAFPEAMVEVPQGLIDVMSNDPKDRHVLAAAVVAKAQVIVTANLKHFSSEALSSWEIEALHPDAFLLGLFNVEPAQMIKVIHLSAQDRRNPVSMQDLLTRLNKTVPNFARAIEASI
jgi:predicted nucleic acid-binding protein